MALAVIGPTAVGSMIIAGISRLFFLLSLPYPPVFTFQINSSFHQNLISRCLGQPKLRHHGLSMLTYKAWSWLWKTCWGKSPGQWVNGCEGYFCDLTSVHASSESHPVANSHPHWQEPESFRMLPHACCLTHTDTMTRIHKCHLFQSSPQFLSASSLCIIHCSFCPRIGDDMPWSFLRASPECAILGIKVRSAVCCC